MKKTFSETPRQGFWERERTRHCGVMLGAVCQDLWPNSHLSERPFNLWLAPSAAFLPIDDPAQVPNPPISDAHHFPSLSNVWPFLGLPLNQEIPFQCFGHFVCVCLRVLPRYFLLV